MHLGIDPESVGNHSVGGNDLGCLHHERLARGLDLQTIIELTHGHDRIAAIRRKREQFCTVARVHRRLHQSIVPRGATRQRRVAPGLEAPLLRHAENSGTGYEPVIQNSDIDALQDAD